MGEGLKEQAQWRRGLKSMHNGGGAQRARTMGEGLKEHAQWGRDSWHIHTM